MSMPISADLLDGVVLAVLKHDDAYGYNLTQQIQDKIPLSPSTLYPVLRRLKAQDWLETYDKPYQGRNRRYYRITEAGRNHLTGLLVEWTAYKKQIDYFLNPTQPQKEA
ncbi:hypothetical protein FC83_GL000005 [Agrilactobacillus composti DSM 18527 = JCM 14202]|jgi:PadR family transcriptional regulator PadR|uniref:Transcription regulator PadR N-terminal domain-containing protein n=1 Tax=Agrilactobacillus composti DSM 18527 = JCM 14202 TaxID=1423734 RepID=A0A0R1Y7P1_9LACO|nr:PadR family transcriptional regulator [Agrilactobacillus composti]KRM36107.1 hypothetical protein FC83_GL000005 [Agrilactobacillus composti DSM 18527 = JCM 14202]MCH4171726.1 PadR family transcriptional regulator [Lactobacillus sp.]